MEEIQEFCRDQLASYKIPQKVFFLSDLPTNPGGKVMKNKLIEQFGGKIGFKIQGFTGSRVLVPCLSLETLTPRPFYMFLPSVAKRVQEIDKK